MRRFVLYAISLAPTLSCSPSKDAPPIESAKQPSVALDHAALRAAWRRSIRYRNAKLALGNNVGSLQKDVVKTTRMLREVEAYERVPIATDMAAEKEAVIKSLSAVLAALKIKGTVIATLEPPPKMPPSHISTEVGLTYTELQIAGRFRVTVTIENGLANGRRFIHGRRQADRLYEIERGWLAPNGQAVFEGWTWFFRDLKPVEFDVPPVDVSALITQAAGAPVADFDERAQKTAQKIENNYAQVITGMDKIKQALAHEATLHILHKRFSVYSALVDRFNATSWSTLIGGKAAPKEGHQHPVSSKSP